MKRIFFLLAVSACLLPGSMLAQVSAHMKLWDQKFRFPRINQIEFRGDEPALAMYDAIYGHGAMWENEWMGFRVYMDHRQSVDLYGKKFPRMELDSTNFYSTPELMDKGFGEDILFVGGSIGAGSFRGYDGDSLVFVAPVALRGQRVLSEGPDTAVVEIYADAWRYAGQEIRFRQRFTAVRGHREVQVDVFLEKEKGDVDVDKLQFCTGVQKLETGNEGFMEKRGVVASWGSNVPDKLNPHLVETLGIAVRVDGKNLIKVKEDDLNYLCIVWPLNGHIRYWLAAASDMQQDGGFHSAKEWFRWAKRSL